MLIRSINKKMFFQTMIFSFLLLNILIRFSSIFYYPPYNMVIGGLLSAVVSASIIVILYPGFLRFYLCAFGFSFFLYGFGSIDLQSRIFEVIVSCVAATVFFVNLKTGTTNRVNKHLSNILICYVGLSTFSILLLPLTQILKDFSFFGLPDAFFYFFIGPPYTFYYPVVSLFRLLLFVVLVYQLAVLKTSREHFKWFFTGIFSGAVFCSILGLLEFYGIIPLAWYRFGDTAIPGVLHSTFLNSGWFAEYILVSVPFVLIGMISFKSLWVKLLLLSTLVLCEVALIFCAARAGWVSYPLILFFCWLFIYFSREGQLTAFRFQWRQFLKIALSVPITIGLSLFIVIQVLIPMLDNPRGNPDASGIVKNTKMTTQYLRKEASTVFTPSSSSRPMRWSQGFSIGMEQPLFGLGFGSYARHALILSGLPSSGYAKVKGSNAYTPHSTFFQLFVSGGFTGLILWLLLIGYASILLITDLIKNDRLLNIPVLIAIIAFHTYGIFQSMQYVPMVWLMIFLFLGYTLTLSDREEPGWLQGIMPWVVKGSIVFVLLGFLVYWNNFESRNLAEKYDMKVYALEQNRFQFAGFFPSSSRWRYGNFHWFGKTGAVYVPGGKAVQLKFFCRTPGMKHEPVILTVMHHDKVIDEILFSKKKNVTRTYKLPDTDTPGKEQKLVLQVSRTWIPHEHLKNFDRRELGVGVRIAE